MMIDDKNKKMKEIEEELMSSRVRWETEKKKSKKFMNDNKILNVEVKELKNCVTQLEVVIEDNENLLKDYEAKI